MILFKINFLALNFLVLNLSTLIKKPQALGIKLTACGYIITNFI